MPALITPGLWLIDQIWTAPRRDGADHLGLVGGGHHQGAAESNCPTGNCPVFKITDGTNTMMAITDRGDIGDLCAPGHAAQPGGRHRQSAHARCRATRQMTGADRLVLCCPAALWTRLCRYVSGSALFGGPGAGPATARAVVRAANIDCPFMPRPESPRVLCGAIRRRPGDHGAVQRRGQGRGRLRAGQRRDGDFISSPSSPSSLSFRLFSLFSLRLRLRAANMDYPLTSWP